LSTDQSGDKSPHSESYDFNPVREFFSSLLGHLQTDEIRGGFRKRWEKMSKHGKCRAMC
jgi:hypothetical protein